MRERWVELEATCLATTEQAILVEVDNEEFWIPRSQLSEDSEVADKGDEGTLIVTRWVAEQKGLA